MFIKTTTNSSGQSYYHLVESYRENGTVHHRTLLSLGKAGEDRLDDLVTAIARHKEIFTVLELAKSISVEQTCILGPLLILNRLFERSGIKTVLSDVAARHPRLGFDLEKLVFTMVASRFAKPGSKLKVFEHRQKKFYPEMIRRSGFINCIVFWMFWRSTRRRSRRICTGRTAIFSMPRWMSCFTI